MALTTQLTLPLPVLSIAFSTYILDCGATPKTVLLFPLATIVPTTCVPCPTLSITILGFLSSSLVKFLTPTILLFKLLMKKIHFYTIRQNIMKINKKD
jgi:hypothetical protein